MAEWSNALQQDSLSPEYLDLFLSGTLGAASMAEWSNALQHLMLYLASFVYFAVMFVVYFRCQCF